VTIPFEDLLIAATAMQFGFAVATGNVRHFAVIPGLTVVAA
jgi:predicted nucleic acid-binding protein